MQKTLTHVRPKVNSPCKDGAQVARSAASQNFTMLGHVPHSPETATQQHKLIPLPFPPCHACFAGLDSSLVTAPSNMPVLTSPSP